MIDGFDSANEPVVPTGDNGLVRLRLDIAYDGTEFSGWARQPQQRTVCGVLEDRLSSIFGVPLELTVAGRTDAGVHASGQVAHIDVPCEKLPRIAPKSQSCSTTHSAQDSSVENLGHLVRRLAKFLPPDVRVRGVSAVPPEFDARFSAFRRHYRYRFSTAAYGVEPLDARSVVSWPRSVDLAGMRAASNLLVGLHDFAAFCKRREGATTVRELQRFDWEVDGDQLTAHVTADAFCWSMVRSLVGAVQAVGDGRRTPEWTADLLNARSRSSSVVVAPAHGLELVQVDYPSAVDLAARQRETREVRGPVESSQQMGESCCGGRGIAPLLG